VVEETGSLSTTQTIGLTLMSRMEFSISNQLSRKIPSVRPPLKLEHWIFGEVHLLMHVLVMLSMGACVVPLEVVTILTLFSPQGLGASTHSTSSMVELRSEPNFQKETGSGQLFGSFPNIILMVNGQHPVRLIWLNQEETIVMEPPEVLALLEQLFIGVQTGYTMPILELLNNISIPNP
jgi:hypothetical protein